jgi:23S rRNA pseudouridine955/2504/2580 synthase
MSGVQTLTVAPDDAEIRLDRWFKRHFPALSHGRLEKLLRTGQVRLDGKRAEASDRVAPGQLVRVPPLPPELPAEKRNLPVGPTPEDEKLLQRLVLYRDDDVIVIDKPAGLAVQGGTGTKRHLDGMLDALRFDAAEKPRLVHRLDKDTSGVLVLARNARSAARLGEAFRGKSVRKVYWAAVVGAPRPRQGTIDQKIAKVVSRRGEQMGVDEEDGDEALTYYKTVSRAGDLFSWMALEPVTGRTHQLRVHCAAIGSPIVGDGKYGDTKLQADGLPDPRKLQLHARAISLPQPDGRSLTVVAQLPAHMRSTWKFLGFDESEEIDPFAELAPER